MGIRFRCPNGHALHVKAFLAGKKGVCPDCGAKVRIPHESAPGMEKERDQQPESELGTSAAAEPAAADNLVATLPAPAAVETAAPVALAAAPVSVASVATTSSGAAVPVAAAAHVAPLPALPMAVPVAMTAAPLAAPVAAAVPVAVAHPVTAAVPAAPRPAAALPVATPYLPPPAPVPTVVNPAGPLPPGLLDPIAEAPQATWYVRPAAGGQFGPARGDVLRQWMGEGRLAGDSLVWRDGWADWRSAAQVFPELAGSSGVAAPGGPVVSSSASHATAEYLARRRSSNTLGIAAMALLGLVCVGLMVALGFILSQQK